MLSHHHHALLAVLMHTHAAPLLLPRNDHPIIKRQRTQHQAAVGFASNTLLFSGLFQAFQDDPLFLFASHALVVLQCLGTAAATATPSSFPKTRQ